VDLRRLRPLDVLTALFGAALIGLLWAPWYRFEGLPSGVRAGTFSRLQTLQPNAWQAMEN